MAACSDEALGTSSGLTLDDVVFSEFLLDLPQQVTGCENWNYPLYPKPQTQQDTRDPRQQVKAV